MRFTLTPAALAPGWREAVLPLAQAKVHLRVDGDEEDDLIGSYREAALTHIERHCAVSLVPRSFVLTINSFGAPIMLPVGPNAAIQSVGYLDTATPGSFADWRLAGQAIVPKPGYDWPRVTGPVTIAFTAGYADVANDEPGLLQAALLLIGHFYAHREAAATGTISSALPLAVPMLLDDVRLPRL